MTGNAVYETELGTFALSLTGLALPVLAAGHDTLVAQFRGNTDLRTLARERGIAAVLNSGHPLVTALEKGSKELATSAEKQAETLMAEAIRRRDSQHRVVGEEGKYGDPDQADSVWVLDPVDGTSRWVRSILAQALGVGARHRWRFCHHGWHDPSRPAQLGLVRELRIVDGRLAGGTHGWGKPVADNAERNRGDRTRTSCARSGDDRLHSPRGNVTTAEQRLDYEILAATAAAVQRDLNAVGAMHVLNGTVHAFVEGDLAGTDAIALIPPLVGGGVQVTDHHGRVLPCDTQSVRRSEYRILAAAPPLHAEITNLWDTQRQIAKPGQSDVSQAAQPAGAVDGYRSKFNRPGAGGPHI